MRLSHFGHFMPVVNAKANPIGPSKTPRPNQRHPFAPLLLATMAAQIPNRSQIIRNGTGLTMLSQQRGMMVL